MGDISEPLLGMTEEKIELVTENVSVVFNVAATVKFEAPMRYR